MTVEDRENAYRYWLHNVPELGERAAARLVEVYGSARAIYETPQKEIEEILLKSGWRQKVVEKKMQAYTGFYGNWKVKENYEKMLDQGIKMIGIWEDGYPKRLKKLHSPPMILYYLGSLPAETDCAVALIGARECSEYGVYMAKAFGERLGKEGISIISGMARGIDGIGQMAACRSGGHTYAVLGCGVDICYPASNRELYEAARERGGILSPFPPGTEPKKQLFPYRNSIVAGLSDAVLVVEARQKSGTWITVDMALEQGKDVYAVPGRLTDRLSDGCNLLIRQGAGIALTPEDIAAELFMLKNRQGGKTGQRVNEDSTDEKRKVAVAENKEEGVSGFLDLTPRSADEILERIRDSGMEMTLPQLLFELVRMCMEGKAVQTGGNYFSRKMS